MHTFHSIEVIPATLRAEILTAMDQVLEEANLGELHLVVAFVDDEEMGELNHTYRGKEGPTDVLSFANWDGPEMPGLEHELGDLVISVDTLVRQAREMGHSVAVEAAVLCVHGLLHLLGLDHERGPAEAVLQAECEMGILDAAGFPVEAALMGRGLF